MSGWLKFLAVGCAVLGSAFAGADLVAKCRCEGCGCSKAAGRKAARCERRASRRATSAAYVAPSNPASPYADNVETFGATAPSATPAERVEWVWQCDGKRCRLVRVYVPDGPATVVPKKEEPQAPAPVDEPATTTSVVPTEVENQSAAIWFPPVGAATPSEPEVQLFAGHEPAPPPD